MILGRSVGRSVGQALGRSVVGAVVFVSLSEKHSSQGQHTFSIVFEFVMVRINSVLP